MSTPTEDEMYEQIDKALEPPADGGRTRWAGMTYEQGVEAALRWAITGDEPPMDES